MKKIFASKERKEALNDAGIRWKVDQDLNFHFDTDSDERKAIKVLKAMLLL